MRAALEQVRDDYDFIVLDCSPSLGLLTLNALTAADSVMVPVQCEYFALEGLGKLLNTVKIVQNQLNPSLEVEGILLTMYDTRLQAGQPSGGRGADAFPRFGLANDHSQEHPPWRSTKPRGKHHPARRHLQRVCELPQLARELLQKNNMTHIRTEDKYLSS